MKTAPIWFRGIQNTIVPAIEHVLAKRIAPRRQSTDESSSKSPRIKPMLSILKLFASSETCMYCLEGQHRKCLGSFCRVDRESRTAYHVVCECECHKPAASPLEISPETHGSSSDSVTPEHLLLPILGRFTAPSSFNLADKLPDPLLDFIPNSAESRVPPFF